MITLRLLGSPEVLVDGRSAPPDLLWRKHLALLVYLHCAADRGVSRVQLLDLLWGDKPEGAARHSLNEALRVIRRGLGDAALDTAGDRVRLVVDGDSDLGEVERLLRAGDSDAAVELVRGPFLEGFVVPGAGPFEDWQAATRLEWSRRCSDLLSDAAERRLDQGDSNAAAALASRAVGLDPLNARAVGVAMRALALQGDRAGALGQHDRFVATLAEMGQEAPAAVAALASRLRAGRAGPSLDRVSAGRTRRPPLLGRESELAELLAAWSGGGGGARLGIIGGDSGTGKSRLLEEVVERARLEGATVVLLRAVAADEADPNGGLRALAAGILQDVPGVASAPAAALAALAEVHPEWADRFPGARGTPPYPLRQALVEVLRAAAAEAATVVAVDDAQWLDADSLRALLGLLRDLAPEPLLLLLVAGSLPARTELEDATARLGRDLQGARVNLGPLPFPALKRLVSWAMPEYDEPQQERLARRIALDSGGLPLLAVELLHAVVGGLDLLSEPPAWPEPFQTLDQTRPGDLPDAIAAAIRIDFRRLGSEARQVLAAAAVLGDRVSVEQLGRAVGTAGPALAAALDELEWHRWLRAEPRGYTHVARIAREVICRDLVTPGQRRRLEELGGGLTGT